MTTTIDQALDAACRSHPYYTTALYRLRLVADPSVPTMATSAAWVTHYNPATVAGWTVAEAGAVLVHELEHLLRQHSERCGDRDHGDWNVAADAEINQRLAGLPDGAVYPAALGMPDGRTAEVYYGAATHQPDKPQDPQDGDGDGDPQDGSGADGGKPQDGDGSGKPQGGSGKPGSGTDCGSAAGGAPRPWEAGDGPAPSDKAQEAIRRRVATDVLNSPGCGGDDADELRDWAEAELGMDRSRWYQALSIAVGRTLSATGAPTRWTWPGRRDPRDIGGAVLPRWTGERPSCAVIIDTSSSIAPGDLDMARAAGHYLGRMADVTYYGCNTRTVTYGATLPEHLRGGGGTNLVDGIDTAIADGAKCVVLITDCMTPWPAEPTRVPIIVGANRTATESVLTPGAWASSYTPPEWITVLALMDPSTD
jgi:hypothetical protein